MLKKRKRLPSIRFLRKKLDFEFNSYIKERDGKCILTGDMNKLHCSHYYDKGATPFLRWDERNAHAMSSRIHYLHHHGKAPNYALWMFKTFGIKYMEKLYIDSLKKVNYKREDYVRMIEFYRIKRSKLREG